MTSTLPSHSYASSSDRSKGFRNGSGNGATPVQQLLGLLHEAEAELDRKDWRDADHLRTKLAQLTRLVQEIPQQEQAEKQHLQEAITEVRRAGSRNDLLMTTAAQLRSALGVDRVLLYQFAAAPGVNEGTVLAESVRDGFTPAQGETLPVVAFGAPVASVYAQEQQLALADIYQSDLTPYQLQLMERFQVRSSLALPIVVEERLWGLVVLHHCLAAHPWTDTEVRLVDQLIRELVIQLQIAAVRSETQQKLQEKDAIDRIIDKVRQPLEPIAIFRTVTQEVRQLINCDRAVIYKFNPDWSGDFEAESVASGWNPLVGQTVKDTNLEQTQGGRYARGEYQAIDDVYATDFDPCHLELLEQFQARAYVLVPVFAGQRVYGILGAYQNSGPRVWTEQEIGWLTQIGEQLGVAARQADALEEMRGKNEALARSVAREQTLSKIVDRIRQSLDLQNISKATVREVRRYLQADRVGVFKLLPETGFNDGEFVAEDSQGGLPAAIGVRIHDHCLGEDYSGQYAQGRYQALSDIYTAGLSECYIEILEQFKVRAHLVVPLVKGTELWGLLCVHQCQGPRDWQEDEIQFVQQVAAQFGIALQQAETLTQLQEQSQQLAAAAERERKAKEQLQQGALRVLKALEPSFRGDLTVRAPLTEDEIGTIADGYNTTIQSLRGLVQQVKASSLKMGETSQQSTTSVEALSQQAQTQFQELENAVNQLKGMVHSIQSVAADAEQVDLAVQEANRTVQAGDSIIEQTVSGILSIRDTVSEAAKKIKRLGESSQKIAKVVSLIDNFATQTNLLALNAAIEATRAGEYGRGFAVVADEVRALAYQSANATTEIERLVQEIQTETKEVTEAMEVGITQVVQGTSLVNETRRSLNAIAEATQEISQLVQGITQATGNQTQQADHLNQTMSQVAEIAKQTSVHSVQIVHSFQDLLTTSQELQASISQFKVD
ncbi:MAG: GAF domain-containing protein [Synechococcaceae cyanobacterium SM2_3_1]|nr:GAF domain-containing protein [Synechococcaceae cyanobacterium SM2_3_1]